MDSDRFLFGKVVFFNASAGKKFGFIRVRGEKEDLFFHFNDGCQFHIQGGNVAFNRGKKVSREPRRDDLVALSLAPGKNGRQKASPWGFRHEPQEGFEYWLKVLASMPAEKKEVKRRGFVCPEWATLFWQRSECTIVQTTEGDCAIVDHSIQSTVYIGTMAECQSFLGTHASETMLGPNDTGFDVCPRHGFFFIEDGCKDCEGEARS